MNLIAYAVGYFVVQYLRVMAREIHEKGYPDTEYGCGIFETAAGLLEDMITVTRQEAVKKTP